MGARLFTKAVLFIVAMGFLFSLLVPFTNAEQEETNERQKVQVYQLPPITVTATRTPKSIRDVSATVSIITREDIAASNATSCTDILNSLPGLFVHKTGVFGRADVNIRGIGEQARRIMVLIDGRPVKMGLFGCTVTHSLPIDNVERIEVVRGPASVLYGSDALGGVINIITRDPRENAETDISLSYGTYNTQQYLLHHGGKYGRFDYYLTADKRGSDGHRPNANYDGQDYTAKCGYALTDHIKATLLGKYFQGKKWEPGTIDQPTSDVWNDYRRSAVDLTFTGDWKRSDAAFKIYRNYGHHQFSDGWHSKDYTDGSVFKYSARALANSEFTVGFEYRKQGGKSLSSPQGEWDKSEWAVYFHGEHLFWGRLILAMGGRYNKDSISGRVFCPHGGLVYHLAGGTTLRVAVNKGFRAPQLNELYMFPPSNKDLKPEVVWDYELGLNQRINRWLTGDVVFYRMKGDNLIETGLNPNPPPQFLFQNVGSFDFRGVEVGLELRPSEELSAKVWYTYLNSGDHTRGRPQDKVDVTFRYKKGKFGGSLTSQWVAGLFAQDNHEDRLDDYFLTNAKINYHLHTHLGLFFAIDNLFDKNYAIYADLPGGAAGVYPMPGRTLTSGITIEF